MFNTQTSITNSNTRYYLKTFAKVKKVIKSCKTNQQVYTAYDYYKLFEKRYKNNSLKSFYKQINEVQICLMDKCKEFNVPLIFTVFECDVRTKKLGDYLKGDVFLEKPLDTVHSIYQTTRVETGRIDCSKLNYSNVPKNKEGR